MIHFPIKRRRCLGSIPFASIALMLFLAGCAEVPLTHRKSLQMLPNSQLMGMSLQEYSNVLKKSKLSQDHAKVEMVRRVGSADTHSGPAGISSRRSIPWMPKRPS